MVKLHERVLRHPHIVMGLDSKRFKFDEDYKQAYNNKTQAFDSLKNIPISSYTTIEKKT